MVAERDCLSLCACVRVLMHVCERESERKLKVLHPTPTVDVCSQPSGMEVKSLDHFFPSLQPSHQIPRRIRTHQRPSADHCQLPEVWFLQGVNSGQVSGDFRVGQSVVLITWDGC